MRLLGGFFMLRQIAFAVLSLLFCSSALADSIPLPAQCNMPTFPKDPRAARESLEGLMSILSSREQTIPWAQQSAAPFRQSLGLCNDKWNSYPDSNGHVSERMIDRCSAALICARLTVLGESPGARQ